MDNVMNQFVLPSMIIQIVYQIRVNESQLTEVQFSLHRKRYIESDQINKQIIE